MSTAPICNAMTVDVEDYFQVSAFETRIHRENWDRQPFRLDRNMDLLLSLFSQHGVSATFFVLGWVAERHREIVRRIVDEGHEVASHGYSHQRASQQNPAEFFEDVTRARLLLEDIGGIAVKGYRAPSFSIGQSNLWALKCLREAGYHYSSSIYPIRHDHYGMPAAPRFAHYPEEGDGLLELPVTTISFFNSNFPAGGGGYFRLLPYKVSRWCLRRVNEQEEQPCLFYFHPWELDPEQPRQEGLTLKTRFRHYVNLGRMRERIESLLQDFKWDRVDRVFLAETS